VARAGGLWGAGVDGGQIATQLALLIVVTTRLVPAVSSLSAAVGNAHTALPQVRGIRDPLASIEHVASHVRVGDETVGEWQQVRFEGVGYRYPGSSEWAVCDISLELGRTGVYGIVGRSAAGKSTLVDILVGLLDPSEGCLRVGVTPLTALDRRDWQRRVGYGPQVAFRTAESARSELPVR